MSAGQMTTAEAIALAKVVARDLAGLDDHVARMRMLGAGMVALAAQPLIRAIAEGEDLSATPWAKFDPVWA